METTTKICATCGSIEPDQETPCCVNDHYNWVHLGDFVRYEGSSDMPREVVKIRKGLIITTHEKFNIPNDTVEVEEMGNDIEFDDWRGR